MQSSWGALAPRPPSSLGCFIFFFFLNFACIRASFKKGCSKNQLTGVVGFPFEDVELGAVCQGVLQAELEESSLGPADAFQQRKQRNSLLALVPALEPTGQHADLVSKHHGEPAAGGDTSAGGENKYTGKAFLPRLRFLPYVWGQD